MGFRWINCWIDITLVSQQVKRLSGIPQTKIKMFAIIIYLRQKTKNIIITDLLPSISVFWKTSTNSMRKNILENSLSWREMQLCTKSVRKIHRFREEEKFFQTELRFYRKESKIWVHNGPGKIKFTFLLQTTKFSTMRLWPRDKDYLKEA